MRTAGVVEGQIPGKGRSRLRHAGVGVQIDLLVFDGPPQKLDEDVVAPCALARTLAWRVIERAWRRSIISLRSATRQKILPTGNLNIGDPFVRGFARILIPDIWGLALGLACVGAFAYVALRRQKQRGALGLEQDSPLTLWGGVVAFGTIVLAVLLTLNAHRSLPLLLVLLVAITALLGWITTSTPFGRSLFAVGGNAESARRVGFKVQRIRAAAFGIVGLMAAIGGIFGASRYGSVSYTAFAGGSLLLEAIGAAVIGGTSLFGGSGSVWNAILGALVIGSLGNGLDLTGASAADKLMVSGAILLLAVAIDAVSRSNAGGR